MSHADGKVYDNIATMITMAIAWPYTPYAYMHSCRKTSVQYNKEPSCR